MFYFLVASILIGMVIFKYLTRKHRVPELLFPDATEEHVLSYSDEYIQIMNERVNAVKNKVKTV